MGSPERTKSSLLQALCQELAQSINQSSRTRWTAVAGNAGQTSNPDLATAAIFCITVTGHLRGEFFLAIEVADLPQLDLNETDADSAEAAIAALFADFAKRLRPTLLGAHAGDIAAARMESLDARDALSHASLQVTSADQTKSLRIAVLLGQALIDSMDASQTVATGPGAVESATNLDLVLDVELNVTLRFGQRQLPLRDILELKSGAVVELDRQVDEPVELVLDGKVVALGEAVIIDGNYGIRVTQVVQPLLAL